jgi:hypothetical protein
MNIMKKCKLCEEEKAIEDFYKCGGNYSSRCKKCFGEYQKNNPNKKANNDKYAEKNREKIREKNRSAYHKDIDKSRRLNREKRKRLRAQNLEHYRKYGREYVKNNYQRLKSNPNWVIRHSLRTRFVRAVTQEYKNSSCIHMLGCSIEEFRQYLESKFQEGMSWENYGQFGWHIDHIMPCAAFDLTKEEEQKKCFHYSNMQPLWWKDNLEKSDKHTQPGQAGRSVTN